MEMITLFSIAGIIIIIGFLGEFIFDKTNIPDVIWLMLLGIIVGRFIDFTGNSAFNAVAPIFTTFALIFILFEGALHIDISKIMAGVASGGSLSFISFLSSLLIVPVVMMFAGWGFFEGLLLGAILGGTSSAVIIPIVKRINIKTHTALSLTFESAITDVLCIVGALTIINIIILKSFSIGFVVQSIVYSFVIAIAIGIIGGLVWVKLQKIMDRFSKSYMTTIAALFLIYSFVEFLGSNGAIACLSFGIVVGNAKKIFSFIEKVNDYTMTPSAKFFFSEISFFVKTFFFVYLGIIINLREIGLLLLGFLLTILLFLIRPSVISASVRDKKLSGKDRLFMEVLVPKGLAAAVLAQLPLQYGIKNGELFSTIVLSVIMFSILFSTLGVFLVEKNKFRGLKHVLDLRIYKSKWTSLRHRLLQ